MAQQKKKILIGAGGTGGHIYPAISLADKLEHQFQPIFVVRKNDRAIKLLSKKNYRYYELNLSGFPRKLSIELLYFFVKLSLGLFSVFRIIKKVKPDCVIGLGSYVSFPVILIAKLFGLSTLIHEQNFFPGLANKLLSYIADKIAVSFIETVRFFPKNRTYWTGNFIRKEFFNFNPDEAFEYFKLTKSKFTILVFGGSQGAHSINRFIVDCLELIKHCKEHIQFIHITGEKDFIWVKETYQEKRFCAVVMPYLEEIWYAYSVADLVISRSGATTVAELIAMKKPAILIPFPYATSNHQLYNAKYLEKTGSAIVLEEKNLTAEKLKEIIVELIYNCEKLKNMVKSANLISNSNRIDILKIL